MDCETKWIDHPVYGRIKVTFGPTTIGTGDGISTSFERPSKKEERQKTMAKSEKKQPPQSSKPKTEGESNISAKFKASSADYITVSQSPAMHNLIGHLNVYAAVNAPILLSGESGTGKSVFAHYIHKRSDVGQNAFVAQNCSAVPKELFESIFFGHKKGSFTGATTDQAGLLEAADGGTLFLDEIAELLPEHQAKLLTVLETGEYRRVGEIKPRKTSFRLITATLTNLEDAIKDGRFRKDFYFRISTLQARVPSLSERKEDIPAIADNIFEEIKKENDESLLAKPNEEQIRALIENTDLPGNIRDLKREILKISLLQAIEEATQAVAEFNKSSDSTQEKKQRKARKPANNNGDKSDITRSLENLLGQAYTLEDITDLAIHAAIEKTDGDLKKAAEILNIEPETINNRLRNVEHRKSPASDQTAPKVA